MSNQIEAFTSNPEQHESRVRIYSRLFPDVFAYAKGSYLYNEHHKKYLDFFMGAGSLNYGHNHPLLKDAIIKYIEADHVIQSLDMHSRIHLDFLTDFHDIILLSRNFDYKIQFTGPTGANAVEAALKLARIYTQRSNIMFFSGSYHGHSLGALSVSDLKGKKAHLNITFPHTIEVPYDEPLHSQSRLAALQEQLAAFSAADLPAAIILETTQGEGGINRASEIWLTGVAALAKQYNILLIFDEIQTGCGRTGSFFSFEQYAVEPDIVCLSKSLSGFGLPLAITLLKPHLDVWEPGEHTGTFRGNNLALVTAKQSLDFWKDNSLQTSIAGIAQTLDDCLDTLVQRYPHYGMRKKGHGLMRGLEWSSDDIARQVSKAAFKHGLIAEVCGKRRQVFKIMPALNIASVDLTKGMDIIEDSIKEVVLSAGGEAS